MVELSWAPHCGVHNAIFWDGMVWYILDRVPQYRSTWYILDHNTGPHPDPARSSPITLCNAKTARNEAEIRISRKKIIKKSQQTLAMSQPSFITCTLNIVQNTMKGWYKCLRSISGTCKVVSKRYTEGSLWEARCLFWCWRWTFLVHGGWCWCTTKLFVFHFSTALSFAHMQTWTLSEPQSSWWWL